mgnify:CR=1 FL=1
MERDYREYRQAEARRRTQELDARVEALQGLLAAGCRAPAFRAEALTRTEDVLPFSPGQLAVPVPMPDPNLYQAQGGWMAGRRAQAQAEARARYEHDWRAAQAAEAQRQRQLAELRRQYDAWVTGHLVEVRRHNAGIAEVAAGVRSGDAEAVVEYFTAALYASTAWPEGFPRQVAAAYDPASRQLVLDWELPGQDVVPEAKSVRYLINADEDKEAPRPVTQRRALYQLGRAYAANQQWPEAVAAFRSAADKGNTSAMVELGVLAPEAPELTDRREEVADRAHHRGKALGNGTEDRQRAALDRREAASSVAPVFQTNTNATCVLASRRPSHPCDERRSAKPS